MQIVWSEEIKEALERVCTYAHKYRVDVTITFGADGDAELRVEPTYWDKTEPTISKMEQVDKDINVRSKDEPTTQTETQNSNLTFEKAEERCRVCNHYKLTCDLFSEICNYEPKDEPQTDCA